MDIKFPSGGIVDLAAGVTGVLPVANGGSGVSTSTGSTNVVLSGSPTITTPVIAQINDANGNETLKLASIASAVNEVTIENAATGSAVHISATGGDASVGLHLAGKGASGYVNVQDSVDATKRIMFNASGGTTNTRTMLSSTQTVDRTISLPDATDTLVGVAATQTLTNKTLTSPTLTAPVLGTPASGTLTNCTFPTLNQNTTGTAAGLSSTLAIASGGTAATTAAAALTSLGAYPATNPSGYTTNVGTVTGVTGTAPVVSSGGTAPAISMAAASSGVNGYMTGTYATKLDGIATGATANTGTVTSVSTSGNVSGITLTGSVTTSGTLTLGGAIGTLNQNTTGSSGSCTGNAATATTATNLSGGSVNCTGVTSSGIIGIGANGAGSDPYGALSVTQPSGANYSYIGLTRSGILGIGMGLDTSSQYWVGNTTAGVAGTRTASWFTANGSTFNVTGAITATGNITAYYSDDRLKTKLGNIENALDKVCSLDGFYYEANETAQALGYKPVREVGLSAQSVQKVLPEVIAPAPIDSQYLTMHYERVVPLLVEAIKELRAEIASLRK